MSAKRHLNFTDADAVAAEVKLLRPGYTQLGHWNLAQISWHLNLVIRRSMRPGPYEPVKAGLVRKLQLRAMLTFGRIPAGRIAPAFVTPADHVTDESIDQFLAALSDLKKFKGEFAPHPLFGVIKPFEFVRFHLVHSAHHLGYLIPTTN